MTPEYLSTDIKFMESISYSEEDFMNKSEETYGLDELDNFIPDTINHKYYRLNCETDDGRFHWFYCFYNKDTVYMFGEDFIYTLCFCGGNDSPLFTKNSCNIYANIFYNKEKTLFRVTFTKDSCFEETIESPSLAAILGFCIRKFGFSSTILMYIFHNKEYKEYIN